MSQDVDKIKRLVAFKKKLEKRVEELESELRELQTMLETVNSVLLEKGFKRAEIAKAPAVTETLPLKEEAEESKQYYPTPTVEHENIIALKATSGEILANLYLSENSLRVVLAEDKDFNVNTPPFTQFLIERVLAKMQEKDSELARSGQTPPDKVFSYEVVQDGDAVREIVIRNVDADRLRELKSSIRWTLEKMYEKMQNQS